eukprot:COSAG06_NODE_2417_length_6906_cov_8.394803_5_plen_83_part_00
MKSEHVTRPAGVPSSAFMTVPQVRSSSQHCPPFCDGSNGLVQVRPQNPVPVQSQVYWPMPSMQVPLFWHWLFPVSTAEQTAP